MKKIAVLMLAIMMVLCTVCSVSADVVHITMDFDSSKGTVSFMNKDRANGEVIEVNANVYNFTITPADGYAIDNVTVSEGSSVIFDEKSANVTANADTVLSITFKEVQVQYECKVTMDIEGGNGKVNFAGADRENGWVGGVWNGNQSATIKPNAGYAVKEVYLDDTKLTVNNNNVKFDVTGDCTLKVTFQKKCTVTMDIEGGNGKVYFAGTDRANGWSGEVYDGNFDATVKPDAGYYVHEVYLNDTKLTGNNNNYNFDVTDNSTLRVTFKKKVQITVNYDDSMGEVKCGSVVPNGGTVEVYNVGVTDFVITPKAGYVISNVMYDGIDMTAFVDSNNKLRVDCKEATLSVTFKVEEKLPTVGTVRYENGITYITIDKGNIGNVTEAGIFFGAEGVTEMLRLIGYSDYDKATEKGTPITDGALAIKVAGVAGLTEDTKFIIKPFVTYTNGAVTVDELSDDEYTQTFAAQ